MGRPPPVEELRGLLADAGDARDVAELPQAAHTAP